METGMIYICQNMYRKTAQFGKNLLSRIFNMAQYIVIKALKISLVRMGWGAEGASSSEDPLPDD